MEGRNAELRHACVFSDELETFGRSPHWSVPLNGQVDGIRLLAPRLTVSSHPRGSLGVVLYTSSQGASAGDQTQQHRRREN